MKLSHSSGLCVLVCNPGPVAAALYKYRRWEAPSRRQVWLSGRRPGWVTRASRGCHCLIVDAASPTLVDSMEDASEASLIKARERIARIGIDGELDFAPIHNPASAQTAYAALRRTGIAESCALAEAQGLIVDAMSSLMSMELSSFLAVQGDSARLSLYENGAYLASRLGGKLSARRFALPSGRAELEVALARFYASTQTSSTLNLDGWKSPEHADIVSSIPAGVNWVDRCTEDVGDAYAALMDCVASLWAEDSGLALFAPRRQKLRNAASRWLPAMALSLVMLSLAMLPFVQRAYVDLEQQKEHAAVPLRQLVQFRSNLEENEVRSDRLRCAQQALNYRNNCIVAVEDSLATLRRLALIQEAGIAGKDLGFDRVGVSQAGDQISVSGFFPERLRSSFDAFVGTLIKQGLRPSSDISLGEDDGVVRFSLNMEAVQ